ncbi:hypothetical protein Bca52824_016487 [Brassica carinata]|uniref:Uncharacterized protein n=1 Tax=Brassica carinata TaxID=52824 RepID=A0A8X8B446_BRACI|nr:hypothetical protein Bca52824_016487 [Brassica carinata]
MPNNENDRPDLHSEINTSGGNEGRQTQSISRDHNLAQNGGQTPVPMGSVLKRLFVGLDPKLKTKIDSNICHSAITPETPSTKRRCVLDSGQSILRTPEQGSCLTQLNTESSKSTAINTTESNIQRNQRKNKRIALDDITNLASRELITNCTPTPPSNKRRCVLEVSMETEQVTRTSDQGSCLSSVKSHVSKATNTCKKNRGPIQKKQHMNGSALLDNITNTGNLSPSETKDEASKTNNERDDDNILDDDEAIDEDLDDFRGIIEELDGSLEFDCSSQEDSDSESDIDCVHHSDGEKIFPNEPESNKMSSSTRANVAHKSLKKKPLAKALGSILSYLD